MKRITLNWFLVGYMLDAELSASFKNPTEFGPEFLMMN